MEKKIEIVESTKEDSLLINEKLVEFNKQKVPFTQKDAFITISYVIKNENSEIIGGIDTVLYCWNILYIDVLWIDESERGKNYGSTLLLKAEEHAKKLGAYMCHLDTFDWQGKEFYIKNGYTVFGTLKDCPQGHNRYFLKKEF